MKVLLLTYKAWQAQCRVSVNAELREMGSSSDLFSWLYASERNTETSSWQHRNNETQTASLMAASGVRGVHSSPNALNECDGLASCCPYERIREVSGYFSLGATEDTFLRPNSKSVESKLYLDIMVFQSSAMLPGELDGKRLGERYRH